MKGGARGLGGRSLLEYLCMRAGIEIVEVNTDASAALGIGGRRGLGKFRHVALTQLRIQDKVTNGEIRRVTCMGIQKPADIRTKHLDANGIRNNLAMCSAASAETRPAIAPETGGANNNCSILCCGACLVIINACTAAVLRAGSYERWARNQPFLRVL